MNILEAVSDGFTDVRLHGGRTALQTLGVILGVASVVATMGLMESERQASIKYWNESGGVLKASIYPKRLENVRVSAKQKASRGLTLDDVAAVRASVPGFDLIEPELRMYAEVRTSRLTKSCDVIGAGPMYSDLHELRVARGRFISDHDVETRAAVAVIGADRARDFFGTEDPIGKIMRSGNHIYQVVGVMEYREFFRNNNRDYNALGWMNEMIIVPVATLQARALGVQEKKIDAIYLRMASTKVRDQAIPAVKRLLLTRHGAEDFQVYDRQDRMRRMNQEMMVYDIAFKVCGFISLIVGGIVVANILLASFTERMREVGVRKALGATGWHIAVQFLCESIVVTGIGGLAGLALGVGFEQLLVGLMGGVAYLTPGMVVAALLSACVVGVAFGAYPAIKAALLDPVVALRYE